jgi:hypothetical protein
VIRLNVGEIEFWRQKKKQGTAATAIDTLRFENQFRVSLLQTECLN